MPATIRADNFPTRNLAEKTFLTADAAVGATGLTVKSTQGLVADDFVFVGTQGQEGMEKRAVGAVGSATGLTVAALSYAHDKFEDVLKVKGDQVRIYRAPNVDGSLPADAAFAAIATVDLDPDQIYTEYEDATGGTGYWYKWTYYNSDSLAETALGAMDAFRGAEFGSYASVEEVREAAGMRDADAVSDTRIAKAREDAENEVNSALYDIYELPLNRPVPGMIHRIVLQLASGYLKNDEYGQGVVEEAPGMPDLRDARSKLKAIQEGELTLIGVDKVSLQTGERVDGWPDNTTATTPTEEGGAPRRHRMGDVF